METVNTEQKISTTEKAWVSFKPLLSVVPCKKHKPKPLDYTQRQEWVDKMFARGKEQAQCKKCGRWYFKTEM